MKTYLFIVRYSMEDLKDGPLEGTHLFADSYLVKLIKDLDNVVYIGVETAAGEEGMPREHFFKAESLDATLEALGIFSDQDEDFTESFMEPDEDGEGSLTMEYKEISDPITEEEREYSQESIEHDPRETIEMLEDEDEDKDDEDLN